MKTNNISKVSYYSCQAKFTSHIWVQLGWRCQRYVSPLVMSTLFVLTYHPCIRSSLHINLTGLAIISPISKENYVSITYLTLKAPGSEKISWALHRANLLTTSQQKTTDIVLIIGLVEMAISSNPMPTIYYTFYETMGQADIYSHKKTTDIVLIIGLVKMAISTNPMPMIYYTFYETMGPADIYSHIFMTMYNYQWPLIR